MQIYRSLGTSAIVALMAAHRAVSSGFDDSVPIFDQAAVSHIAQCLMEHAAETDETLGIRQTGREAQ
jgi:hypothetical protein